MFLKYLLIFTLLTASFVYSQNISVNKVEPPNWWAGMRLNKIQLMVYGSNLNNIKAEFNNKSLKVTKIKEGESAGKGAYCFINIEIPANLGPGNYKLLLNNGLSKTEVLFPVLQREKNSAARKGFSPEDIIYLLMPDRFSDGDESNNIVEGYKKDYNRSKVSARHGGDIQGIINHLDYIKDAGYTALWINPVIENNSDVSYHGYGATDFYKVDPRFGTNDLYKKLVEEAHKRNIKVILDHVANHIHINHPWMKNPPFTDWINGNTQKFITTNHDKVAIADIHGDGRTEEINTTGWFTDYMPDLNQKNSYMAAYILQNTIWWMEFAGIDAIREDTYPYADAGYMSKWAKAIMDEYPNTNIVGEVWKGEPAFLSLYQQKNKFRTDFNTYLPSVTDFGISEALRGYLAGTKNLTQIYEILGMDYLYSDPNNLVTFIDNHDVERAMFVAKENIEKVEIALKILLTTRGIPQLLYGTEIASVGGASHGELRIDFPGGFPDDKENAFSEQGRTETQTRLFNLLKRIITIRKENKALSSGKLIHYPPNGGIYYYFRVLGNDKIMIIINDNENESEVNLSNAASVLKKTKKIVNLETGENFNFNGTSVKVSRKSAAIFKLIEE